MNRRRCLSLSTISCLATLVTIAPFDEALAAMPGEINFQGLLLDSGGEPVNGLVDLDFELFDAASAGTSLWSESQPDVSVLAGCGNTPDRAQCGYSGRDQGAKMQP